MKVLREEIVLSLDCSREVCLGFHPAHLLSGWKTCHPHNNGLPPSYIWVSCFCLFLMRVNYLPVWLIMLSAYWWPSTFWNPPPFTSGDSLSWESCPISASTGSTCCSDKKQFKGEMSWYWLLVTYGAAQVWTVVAASWRLAHRKWTWTTHLKSWASVTTSSHKTLWPLPPARPHFLKMLQSWNSATSWGLSVPMKQQGNISHSNQNYLRKKSSLSPPALSFPLTVPDIFWWDGSKLIHLSLDLWAELMWTFKQLEIREMWMVERGWCSMSDPCGNRSRASEWIRGRTQTGMEATTYEICGLFSLSDYTKIFFSDML